MKIMYSDVVKGNEVLNQIKKELIPNLEGRIRYFKGDLFDYPLEIKVERHATRAGNHYFIVKSQSPIWKIKEVKVPMNVEVDKSKVLKQIEKMVIACRKLKQDQEELEARREANYNKFMALFPSGNSPEWIKYDSSTNKVYGGCSVYLEKHFSENRIEEDIKEVRNYYEKYREQQAEIKRLQTLMGEITTD